MYQIFVILFILTAAVVANAQSQKHQYNLYIKGEIGGFIPANKFKEIEGDEYITKKPKKGTVYNIGLGYVVNDSWRGDLNFNYRNLYYKASEQDIATFNTVRQKVKMYNAFLNGYFDVNLHTVIKSYLCAGVGYGINNSGDAVFQMDEEIGGIFPGKKTNNFTWNIGAGVRIILHHKFNLDFSYKYVYLGKVTTKPSSDNHIGRTFKVKSHDIMGGATVYL